jgi:protein-tyrosine-phosphatase
MQAKENVFRVLFLCTGNSARSQIAEAVLNRKGRGRFVAESAGSRPATRVNPHAIQTLRDSGIEWRGHAPRGLEGLDREPWDLSHDREGAARAGGHHSPSRLACRTLPGPEI